MRPYSMDLRRRVVAACDLGDETREEIAERFQVSTAWIRRLLQRRRETGSFAALPQNSGPKPILDEAGLEALDQLVKQKPDATLKELKEGLGLKVSDGVILRGLAKLKLSLKKSHSGQASRTGRM